jgi:hypothetical protein
MTTHPAPAFTDPSTAINQARYAIARLQRHLAQAVGAIDASADLSSIAFAILTLESVHPPYPPLSGDVVSEDPAADLDAAIAALLRASGEAPTARETLRFAYVIRDLRELENSPYLVARHGAAVRRP